MRTFGLPNGSITSVVDVTAVRVHKHFFRSDRFYVGIEFRNGSTEDVAEHLTRQAADDKQAEIAGLIREAWVEVKPMNMAIKLAGPRVVRWAGQKVLKQAEVEAN